MIIRNISVKSVTLPLKKPYALSFTTLTEFESIRVNIELDTGDRTEAEVVPLPGYVDETSASILTFLDYQTDLLKGLELEVARAQLVPHIAKTPFAVTALLTAIDLFEYRITPDKVPPLVLPTAVNGSTLTADLHEANSRKVPLKIKLTGNLEVDVPGLDALMTSRIRPVVPIRMDANQAYSLQDALDFYTWTVANFKPGFFEYVEQPLDVDDWEGVKKLVTQFPELPTMLDECIITDDHVEWCIQHRIPFIKLKLFKQGGIKEVIAQASRASENGIRVILGNGVATSFSNQIENWIFQEYPDLFYGASEANGYVKIKTSG